MRDKALGDIRDTLTDWFTATSGKSRQVFRYSSAWSSLIGYPADFFSDTELNDHHFHYGYYVVAAATLARFDPAWADSYGPMVEMLIRDVNSPDRGDAMFPYLRYFNAYSGHDYAAGPAPYDGGNNQESSSEAMNAAYGMIMWGEATGNKAIRDAGVYIYTTQAAAINDYWFNDNGEALPAGYTSPIVPVIWTNGGTGGLFFGNGERAYKFGINTLPVTGGFLYLTAGAAQRNYDALQAAPRLGGENANEWRDIHLSALALADGPAALAGLNQLGNYSVPASGGLPYTNEHGETKAHTYHWIANLAALGRVDRSLTANYPGAVAFTRNGAKSYVVTNVSGADLTVTFSDCTRVIAPRGKVTVTGPSAATLGSAPGGRGLSVPIPGWPACVADPDPEEPVDPGNPVDPAHPMDPETPIAPVTRPAPPLTRTPGPGAKTSTLKITRVTVTKGRYRKSKKAIRVRKAARVTIKFATSADFKPNAKVSLVIGKTIGRAKLVRKSARTWVAHVKVKAKVNTKRGKVTIRYGKAGKKPSIANRKLLRIR